MDPARPLPRHVAIIMDGNGRWARQQGLPHIEGHRAAVRAVRETVQEAARLGLGPAESLIDKYCAGPGSPAAP